MPEVTEQQLPEVKPVPGFYRKVDDAIECSISDLFGPGWDLLISEKDQYTYPAHGWYWFDSKEEAENFFNS